MSDKDRKMKNYRWVSRWKVWTSRSWAGRVSAFVSGPSPGSGGPCYSCSPASVPPPPAFSSPTASWPSPSPLQSPPSGRDSRPRTVPCSPWTPPCESCFCFAGSMKPPVSVRLFTSLTFVPLCHQLTFMTSLALSFPSWLQSNSVDLWCCRKRSMLAPISWTLGTVSRQASPVTPPSSRPSSFLSPSQFCPQSSQSPVPGRYCEDLLSQALTRFLWLWTSFSLSRLQLSSANSPRRLILSTLFSSKLFVSARKVWFLRYFMAMAFGKMYTAFKVSALVVGMERIDSSSDLTRPYYRDFSLHPKSIPFPQFYGGSSDSHSCLPFHCTHFSHLPCLSTSSPHPSPSTRNASSS